MLEMLVPLQNLSQSSCEYMGTQSGEAHMRIAGALFAGSVAALAVLMAPALAKNSDVQKPDEKSASSTCHSYQMAADGTWTALPCQELGISPPARPKSSSASQRGESH